MNIHSNQTNSWEISNSHIVDTCLRAHWIDLHRNQCTRERRAWSPLLIKVDIDTSLDLHKNWEVTRLTIIMTRRSRSVSISAALRRWSKLMLMLTLKKSLRDLFMSMVLIQNSRQHYHKWLVNKSIKSKHKQLNYQKMNMEIERINTI